MHCLLCSSKIAAFNDSDSQKEFELSGMCESCQDGYFGKMATPSNPGHTHEKGVEDGRCPGCLDKYNRCHSCGTSLNFREFDNEYICPRCGDTYDGPQPEPQQDTEFDDGLNRHWRQQH